MVEENPFENIVRKMTAISSRLKCVKKNDYRRQYQWKRRPYTSTEIAGAPFNNMDKLQFQYELEQLERLRSEDTPRRLMITNTIESCWIPSQN